MQKWRNSDVHQSVEQKYQFVDIGFLVSLKSSFFQALAQTLFKSKFSKKTISRDLLTQELTPNRVPEQKYLLRGLESLCPFTTKARYLLVIFNLRLFIILTDHVIF